MAIASRPRRHDCGHGARRARHGLTTGTVAAARIAYCERAYGDSGAR